MSGFVFFNNVFAPASYPKKDTISNHIDLIHAY